MSPIIELLLIVGLFVAGIIIAISVFKLHPVIALGLAALGTGLLLGYPITDTFQAIVKGFVGVLVSIGIIILLGAILGALMEKSGSLNAISHIVLKIFGENRPITALSVLGLVVGIPVFCDSGFIILSKAAKKVAEQRGIKASMASISLAGGLYTAHTLIPPTPGPIAAAGNMGMSGQLGLIIITGLLVSIPILVVLIIATGLLYKDMPIPQQTVPEFTQKYSNPVLLAPIVIAILFISIGSLSNLYTLNGNFSNIIKLISHPIFALSVASLTAWAQIPKKSKQFSLVKKGFMQAIPIILITAMGGAFGQVLKQSSLASSLMDTFSGASHKSSISLLFIGYIISLIIKTAQGSSTAAIIITSSILFPLSTAFDITPWQTAILISAIGSGAMAVSHANDSYFWVVTKFSEMTVREGYTRFSVMTMILSITGMLTSCALFLLLV